MKPKHTIVTFKFALDQEVRTPVSVSKGIVSMQAIDSGGRQYFVKTAMGGDWWRESQLTPFVG